MDLYQFRVIYGKTWVCWRSHSGCRSLDGEIPVSPPNSPCNLHPFTLPTEAIAFFDLKTQNNDCTLPTWGQNLRKAPSVREGSKEKGTQVTAAGNCKKLVDRFMAGKPKIAPRSWSAKISPLLITLRRWDRPSIILPIAEIFCLPLNLCPLSRGGVRNFRRVRNKVLSLRQNLGGPWQKSR